MVFSFGRRRTIGEIKDIFAVEDEIAQAATEALQLKLLGGNGQPVASNLRSTNPEAYQAYLQANILQWAGTEQGRPRQGARLYRHGHKLDAKYAPAWALRASVQNWMASGRPDRCYRRLSKGPRRRGAGDCARSYLGLSLPGVGEDANQLRLGLGRCQHCLTKAAALEPGNVEIFRIRAYRSEVLGNLDQAIKLAEQAVALDPLRANFIWRLG